MKIEKMMWHLLLAGALIIGLSSIASAVDTATKEECEAKVKAAVELATKSGVEEALKQVQDPAGPFVWKDSYVFAVATDSITTVAHPINPKHVGKSMLAVKDVDGKAFFMEFADTANTKGSGWVTYKWPKPGETNPAPKDTFVMKVPGKEVLFGAGIYTN